MEQAEWFFSTLFDGAVSSESLISIWTLPDKRTSFFSCVKKAAEYAAKQSENKDVYFGCGLYRPDVASGRGTVGDVVAITSLWCDIDIGDEGNGTKTGRPPTLEAALGLIGNLPVKPSIIVDSGHGLHGYWLLKEPMTLADGAEKFARRWGSTIGHAAGKLSYRVDTVSDLARVLRVPGTMNRKREPKPVSVLTDKSDIPAYVEDDFEKWFVDPSEVIESPVPRGSNNTFVIDFNRRTPTNKLILFIDADPKIKQTWSRSRDDFTDNSDSSYDMALVNYAVQAGWEDQDIVDLLITWADSNGIDRSEKYGRRDYLERTIAKARRAHVAESAIEELHLRAHDVVETTADHVRVVEMLSKFMGVKIRRFIQLGRDNAVYTLVLEDGREIQMGGVDVLASAHRFKNRLLEAAQIVISPKKGKWDAVVENLTKICEVIEADDMADQMVEAVHVYLDSNSVNFTDPQADVITALAERKPFSQGGYQYLSVSEFVKDLRIRTHQVVKKEVVADLLRRLGWTKEKVRKQRGSHQVGRWYMKVSLKVLQAQQDG